ncbi:superoxide dismutase family protein [Nocardia sp. 348MFTsu5.1]|uniref:superoxide dismutase[Cu-Zn] n=1 Tax=Nocardia sp. 348MFTsu5.1 TaxID=1172185 RepID=UPI000366A012|nr:superoxide dismutase family protein [Nocardia sp. 348MFTsu5.1]
MAQRSLKNLGTLRRTAALVAPAAMALLVVAGCSAGQEASDVPGTQPSVVTGDPAPLDVGAVGDPSEGGEATAALLTPSGGTAGVASFDTVEGSVVISVTAENLAPGFHGMHIHAVGKCEANSVSPTGGAPGDFLSAGGHLQVEGNDSHPASGDLVSIYINDEGKGETVTTSDNFDIEQLIQTAIVIHEKPDNFGNIPTRYAPAPDEETLKTGDGGKRIACGVIEKS